MEQVFGHTDVSEYIFFWCTGESFRSQVYGGREVYGYECMQLSQGWAKDPCCAFVFIVFSVCTPTMGPTCLCFGLVFGDLSVWTSKCISVWHALTGGTFVLPPAS